MSTNKENREIFKLLKEIRRHAQKIKNLMDAQTPAEIIKELNKDIQAEPTEPEISLEQVEEQRMEETLTPATPNEPITEPITKPNIDPNQQTNG